MKHHLAAWVARHEVIVLEGCDGAGKTTVADALVSAHAYTSIHCGRTPDDTDLVSRYREILARPGRLVLDRSFLSELVYGPLYHGQSRLSIADATNLALAVAERDGVLVHLTGQPEEIAARLQSRDGRSPSLSEIRKVLDSYANIFTALAGAVPIITADPSRWAETERF
jgi:thymidylate kinase